MQTAQKTQKTIFDIYIPEMDKILKRMFPKYYQNIKGLSKHQQKNLQFLSQDEVIGLYNKYKQNKDLKSRDTLIISQLPLVFHYAQKFFIENQKTSLTSEDILGFANTTLIELIDDYKPFNEKGEYHKFASYIRTFLDFKLHNIQKDLGYEITMPFNQLNDITNYEKILAQFEMKYAREPYNGESFEIKNKSSVFKYTFDFDEKLLLIEKYVFGNWSSEKPIKICEKKKVLSGDSSTVYCNNDKNIIRELIGERLSWNEIPIEYAEIDFFDTIESDDSNYYTKDNQLLEALKMAVGKLSQREQESLNLIFNLDELAQNIPALLKPDLESKKEVNTLKNSSKNSLDIYITKANNEQVHLNYNITANYHVEKCESIPQSNAEMLITHKFKNKSTNIDYDKYKFHIEGATNIKITHTTHNSSKELQYLYDGYTLQFEVNYKYGIIFATQTLLNNKEKIINKLRLSLKNYKYI